MAEITQKAAASIAATAVPPLPEETDVKAGPGQTVVTSPTGTKSVVLDYQVDSLKHQGYKV